jgi:superfamily I DNA and RNA helicase
MMDLDVIKLVATIVTPFLVMGVGGLIGYFVKNTLQKTETMDRDLIGIKKDIERISDTVKGLSFIREEWLVLKGDVSKTIVELKSLNGRLEDVIILKRDQATMWSRIDELRKELKEIEK